MYKGGGRKSSLNQQSLDISMVDENSKFISRNAGIDKSSFSALDCSIESKELPKIKYCKSVERKNYRNISFLNKPKLFNDSLKVVSASDYTDTLLSENYM